MHAPVQPAASRDPAKDQPLIDDIRLLGSMLGDVIREHDGQSSFALVENVRRLSVSYQRDSDVAAGHSLELLLRGMTPAQAVSVIRAFSYFSHLANIAEDRHRVRRRALHAHEPGPVMHQEGEPRPNLRALRGSRRVEAAGRGDAEEGLGVARC